MKNKNNYEVTCEVSSRDDREIFLESLSDLVVDLFQVGYKDRSLVKNLLMSSLKNKIYSQEGLLEFFLHSQLDILAEKIKSEFELDDDLKVNYDYATHAKFNDIFEALNKKVSQSNTLQYDPLTELLDVKVIPKKCINVLFVVGKQEDILKAEKCKHDFCCGNSYPAIDTDLNRCIKCKAQSFTICFGINGEIE